MEKKYEKCKTNKKEIIIINNKTENNINNNIIIIGKRTEHQETEYFLSGLVLFLFI